MDGDKLEGGGGRGGGGIPGGHTTHTFTHTHRRLVLVRQECTAAGAWC